MNRYMVVEYFKADKVKALYERFDREGRLLPEGVHYLDSWINEDVTICYQLMESESLELLQLWLDRWRNYADFEVVPVINSATARAKVFESES